MTKKKDLKRRVRERQAKTGERYAAALAQVRKPQVTALPDVTREAEAAGLRCNAVVSETLRAQGDLRSLLVRVRELLEALGASACGPLLRGEAAPREFPDATRLAAGARRFLAQARAGRRGLSPDGRLFVLQWNDVAIVGAITLAGRKPLLALGKLDDLVAGFGLSQVSLMGLGG